jgi:uncharacterized protein YqfB (UPF0267 family)
MYVPASARALDEDELALVDLARRTIDEHTDAGPGEDGIHTVGAAVMAADYRMFAGVNLYHFTGGPCAELVALAAARAQGARQMRCIVAVGNHIIRFNPRYLDAVRSGTKTRTTRFRDPAQLGPARLVFECDPEVVLTADVTDVKHCLVDELADEDARAEGLTAAAELRQGIKRHYPNLAGTDEVDVVTFVIRDKAEA